MIKNNKIGRPQKINKGRNIVFEVLQSLPQDGSPIRFKDLRERVDMSSATLSKALFYLCSIGEINKLRVPSQRGKGIVYQKAPDNPVSQVNWTENAREQLIQTKNEKSEAILKDFEFIHASELCLQVSVITQAIFNSLKCYADSDRNKRDALLETHLYLINGLIKELSKKLVDEPLGMSDFTYNICFRACATLMGNLYDVLDNAAKVMGWEDSGMKGLKYRTYLHEYPADKFKELLVGYRLEIEKLKQEKERLDKLFYDERDNPRYKEYLKSLDDRINYFRRFEPKHKKV